MKRYAKTYFEDIILERKFLGVFVEFFFTKEQKKNRVYFSSETFFFRIPQSTFDQDFESRALILKLKEILTVKISASSEI